MAEQDWLVEAFEAHRGHLRAVAYRMLGSASEADDALQESWVRFSRADTNDVDNLGGWLTTVVARVCLNMLRSRTTRREEPLDDLVGAPAEHGRNGDGVDPERDALFADAVGPALLVVLDTLSPAERLAFVLHDMFAMPFSEIAPIVGRSEDATRQLASRARRRVQGAPVPQDPVRQRPVVDAFLAAARNGDFDALLEVLDPDVVLRADAAAVRIGAAPERRGAAVVAQGALRYRGGAQNAHPALVDGGIGAALTPGGRLTIVLAMTISGDRIVAIEVIADPARLEQLDVILLDD